MDDLKKILKEDTTVIIDVRSKGEFSSGSFPKAINIPHSEISAEKLPSNKDQKIVVFCASGMRSSMAYSVIKGLGYKNVFNASTLSALKQMK